MILGIIIGLILAIIIYLGGGWCVYNIYLSISPLTDNMTVGDIVSKQILVYAIVAVVFNFLSVWRAEHLGRNIPEYWVYVICIPLGLWALSLVLPISEGFAILNTVINIILTTCCFAMWIDREIN